MLGLIIPKARGPCLFGRKTPGRGESGVTIPLYIVMLGLSSGLAGIMGRRLLAAQGFVPNFESGTALAAALALSYAAVQLAYMALLRLSKPSSGKGPIAAEILSQAGALALVPYVLQLQIPWPHPALQKVEPLLFLVVFGAIHGFFKLVSLFAATQTVRGPRGPALGWVAGCALCALGGWAGLHRWHGALETGRETRLPEPSVQLAGTASSEARPVYEGGVYVFPLEVGANRNVVFRWANPPDAEPKLTAAYVQLRFEGGAASFSKAVEIKENTWSELVVPAEALPPGGGRCRLSWSSSEEPAWVTRTGLRPKASSTQFLLLSGPFHHAAVSESVPSMILLAVEGLGAENVSVLGYRRSTTPAIDALAVESFNFSEAYTPAPDMIAGGMTLLSGAHPLAHHYLEGRRGPLPEHFRTLPERLQAAGYATCAFTEGMASDDADLVAGSGFDRGFEWFDAEYRVKDEAAAKAGAPEAPEPLGSRITLEKAANWILDHRAERYFVFIRLRELRAPMRLKRYGEGFLGRGRTPTPLDLFDTALLDVDRQMAAFVERLRGAGILDNTAVVVTAPYGFDFSEQGRGTWRRGGPPARRLTESSLRVPLFFHLPGGTQRTDARVVSLEDVAPTLMGLAGLPIDPTLAGRDLLREGSRPDVVSVFASPLALSVRTGQWRFTWQSGKEPFTGILLAPESPVDFVDIERYRGEQAQQDLMLRMPESAKRFRDRLAQYFQTQLTVGKGS